MNFELEESERQLILLALAELAIRRPGWDGFASEVAKKLETNTKTMFELFKQTSTDPLGRPLEVAIDVPRGLRAGKPLS